MHKITGKTIVTGVIGGNIKGSLSPAIHNFWYMKNKIDGVYVAFETTSDNFKKSIEGLFLSGIRGMNVTVPFKENAFEIADDLTDQAIAAKAVNLLYINKNGKISGHNTDGFGFVQSIKKLDNEFDFSKSKILIIGAGGAASGVLLGLIESGITKCDIINRTFSKAKTLVGIYSDKNINIRALEDYSKAEDSYDLIIQTTALRNIQNKGINDIPEYILSNSKMVIDINYGYKENDFLDRANKIGLKTCDGLEMLIQQARPSFAILNDTKIPEVTDDLYDFLQKEL